MTWYGLLFCEDKDYEQTQSSIANNLVNFCWHSSSIAFVGDDCRKDGDTMIGRDKLGRFTPGHSFAVKGWEGLIKKRFQGDSVAAREWLAAIGKHSYMMQTPIRRTSAFKHPGDPETFLSEWRKRLDFRLSDVEKMEF